MFHYKDNLFFGRTATGHVRILKFKPLAFKELGAKWPMVYEEYPVHLVELDVTIDEYSWASIVASVSEAGESGGRYYEALDFHNLVSR